MIVIIITTIFSMLIAIGLTRGLKMDFPYDLMLYIGIVGWGVLAGIIIEVNNRM